MASAPLTTVTLVSEKAKEVVQILEEDEVKNHENICTKLDRCLVDKSRFITDQDKFISRLYVHGVLGDMSPIKLSQEYPAKSTQLHIAIGYVSKKWTIKELMCALEEIEDKQVIDRILEWARQILRHIKEINEVKQVNSQKVQDGNNNDSSTFEQIEIHETIRPGRRSESSIPPRSNPVEHAPSRDSGFGETSLTTNSPVYREAPNQEIFSATLQRIRRPRQGNLKKALSESDISEILTAHWQKTLDPLDEAESEKLIPQPVDQSVELSDEAQVPARRQPPSEGCNMAGKKGEQELSFSDVVHKATGNKVNLAKEIESCIQKRKTLVEIHFECECVKRVSRFVQVKEKFFRNRGPREFPVLRVVRIDIKTDKHDKLKYPSPELIESLFFFLPDFRSKDLVNVNLNEILIKINGRVYVNMVKEQGSCSLVLQKLKIFSPQQFLADPKLNLVSLSCMLLPVPLKLLQNCVSLQELNLNNCDFPQEGPMSNSKDNTIEECLHLTAQEMSATLVKLPNLKKLVVDMGRYKGHFDFSVLPKLKSLEKLIIGHCILEINESEDVEAIRNFNGQIILYNCQFSTLTPTEFIRKDYDQGSTIVYLEKGKEPRLEGTTYNITHIRDPQKQANMTQEDEKKWFDLFMVERFVEFSKSPLRREW